MKNKVNLPSFVITNKVKREFARQEEAQRRLYNIRQRLEALYNE